MIHYIEHLVSISDVSALKTLITNIMEHPLIAWTQEDVFNDGTYDHLVYSTQGESGTKIKCYVHFRIRDASHVDVSASLYWDIATHTGTCKAQSDYINMTFTNGQLLRIHGNKNLVYMYPPGRIFFGFITNIFNDVSTQFTESIDASNGLTQTLAVQDSTQLTIGDFYQIVGNNSEGMQTNIQLLDKPDSTHIQISGILYSFSSSSFIGTYPALFIMGNEKSHMNCVAPQSLNGIADVSGKTYLLSCLGDHNSNFGYDINRIQSTNMSKIGISLPEFVVENAESSANNQSSYIAMPENFYYSHHASWSDIAVTAYTTDIVPIAGTVELSTINSITDSLLSLIDDSQTDRLLYIESGLGAGQVRKIAGNTSDTITTVDDWFIQPDSTSAYYIADELLSEYSREYMGFGILIQDSQILVGE